ncbi:helix-turn-helix domain-containing protein [Rossellomorea aquimaris]|uniref:Helix-turn-helix transcriptional regulator n=1 Tax=Rossellomorea aquimaris TaxID=189382 RepID=A0A5D4U8H4_9BACI|nr:helix-turn-helix transcriptional regulator [Rossellomorea aquimaris]TYS76722.1 helix-turn-helix transcriptional regulator [Rossellomorea aquimaris]TYS83627.1 helix-turn-helix transcriptional regulator [Rossellomorea aquimaris]TYS89176.1 helix-turn-helix transcriptional regulator [Rossellomorea aquimaris]
MDKGKIIKFYRQKAKLTQEQLGYGICSNTHVSKIEQGKTDYSSEITSLFSKRLGINIDEELMRYKNIKRLLHCWHDAMIRQRDEEIETIKNELEKDPLITISDYHVLYELLNARYHLLHQDLKQADKIIKTIKKKHKHLPPYEKNLLKHLSGIYYLSKNDVVKAFTILGTINADDYNNEEYYLTLAASYLASGSMVMAYYFAEKSLRFFINSNNFLKIIDAEMIMLMTRDSDRYRDFQQKIEQYDALIQTCDLCHAFDKKAQVLHNLAYEYYNKNEYESAKRLYEQSMSLKKKDSTYYLISLEGFIRNCLDGNLLTNNELEELVFEGMATSRKINDYLYSINFKLLHLLINNEHTEYYNYLITNALPYFKKRGVVPLVQQYEKELFHHYLIKDETNKALEMATKVLSG